jgi:hypothetical protein
MLWHSSTEDTMITVLILTACVELMLYVAHMVRS